MEALDATSKFRWVTRPGRRATIEGTEASETTTSSRALACGMSRRLRAYASSLVKWAWGVWR
jgi:hypothetical protein